MIACASRLGGLLAALFLAIHAVPALAESRDGIVVYNAQHENLTQAWADGFTKETGIKVTLRNGGDSELGNLIVQEGRNSPADVFLTENSPAMVLVDKEGLIAPLDPAVLAEVPEALRSADGRWTGVAARSTVFAYNKQKLKPEALPRSIMDLAGEAWKGRWAASPAGADFQAIVGAMLALKGETATKEWLAAMKRNAVAYRGNTAAMKAVNAGEVDGAVIYHYYWFGDQARTGENSENVALHYFRHQDPGAFVSVSGGAVLASSQHKAEAQALLKWIVGKGGQEILRTGNSYEYAVGKGAPSNAKLEPLASLGAPDVPVSKLDGSAVVRLMIEAGLL
jgi:iron(III) transport system substrate-binding protein